MATSGNITNTLSLDSLRRQLEVYETALHKEGYNEWLDGDDTTSNIPIMRSLRSPTTRALTAIQENRDSMWVAQREIARAVAEGAAMRELVLEAEALQSEPILSHFRDKVANGLHAEVGMGCVPSTMSDRARNGSVLLAGVSPPITVEAGGALTFTDPITGRRDQPVLLGANEEPVHMLDKDAMDERIVSHVVFAMPRDAAGNMLELMPSAILTRASHHNTRSEVESFTRKARDANAAKALKANGDVPLEEVVVDVSLAPREYSLKELLQQQQELGASRAASEAVYKREMVKYDSWQTKRMGLLDHFTEPDSGDNTVHYQK